MHLLLDGQETERLYFRKMLPTDFSNWLPFHEDKRTSQFWSGLPDDPITACEQDFERTFERYSKNLGGKMALILNGDTTLVGLCGLLVQEIDGQREIEIAYSLLPKYWGQGFAKEAAEKCKEVGLGLATLNRLISIIHIDNVPSQKVALGIGMHLDRTTTYTNNPVHIFYIRS